MMALAGGWRQSPMWAFMQPFQGAFLQMFWLSFLTNVLMLVPTLYMLQLYDRVMLSRNTLTLVAMTLLTAGLLVFMAGADWLRSLYAVKTGVQFDLRFGKQVFAATFDPGRPTSSVPQQALQQLTAVRQWLTGQGLFALLDIPWSLIYIAVLFALHPLLGMTAIAFCLVQCLVAWWHQHVLAQPGQETHAARQRTEHFLQQKIQHAQTSHVLGMMQTLRQHWQQLLAQQAETEDHWQRQSDRSQFLNKWVRYCLQSLMLAVAAWLTIEGEISVGSMVASNVLIARALQPFDVMVQSWRQWLQAKTAAGELQQMMADVPVKAGAEVQTMETVAAAPLLRPYTLQLTQVGVSHGARPLLQAVDVSILPGRLLCVMGPSGAGKSTLARLLVGAVFAERGRYEVNQTLLTPANVRQSLTSVGYLPQQVSLLEGTIAENVARFGPLETPHILQACQRVGLHEAILRLPQGYDTRLDAQGLPLSGGQRQLLGLARAIYKEPALLVLDEPNASLDEFGEARLLQLLQALKTLNTTIVVISHRSGILKITDDLLVLKRGEVLHHGPRDAGIVYLNQLQAASPLATTE